MIRTILRIGFINLRRDRVVQALTFVLPILFFSIFATVFGNQRNVATRRTQVAVVDEDGSEFSRRLVRALQGEGALRIRLTKGEPGSEPLSRASAEAMIKSGDLPVAIVLPKGIGGSRKFWGDNTASPKIQLLADVSDPVAPQLVQGLLQKVSFTAAPEVMAGLTTISQSSGSTAAATPAMGLPVELVNVMQPGGGDSATISFYAAGIGVMFLLFSCAGAGGTLLDEEETGTLGRLIGARGGMRGVLAGKWLFIAIVGTLQLTVMFVWGALVFGLPLRTHLPGFFLMTIVTAAAAAAFGLVLATLSRSRGQLSGMSTIIILTMSALGGSMFPRFLMTETMQKVGLVTFNAWALDGYLGVFWRDSPLLALWPQLLVLCSLTVAFLVAARMLGRRWETL